MNIKLKMINKDIIEQAEKCLIDNGIEPDEAETVLQALGYILLDMEIYTSSNDMKLIVKSGDDDEDILK